MQIQVCSHYRMSTSLDNILFLLKQPYTTTPAPKSTQRQSTPFHSVCLVWCLIFGYGTVLVVTDTPSSTINNCSWIEWANQWTKIRKQLNGNIGRNNIDHFHSRDQQPYWFNETKESICIKIEFSSKRVSLVHQYGRHSFVLVHQHGHRDVMWKRSISNNNVWFQKISITPPPPPPLKVNWFAPPSTPLEIPI